MSPQAGALFGFDLLWLVLAAHLLKYPAFEFGPRYAAATGESLLAGYALVPGPKQWALWLFLGSTVLQGVGVLAGVVMISGTVLHTWTGILSIEIDSVLLLGLVLLLLFAGGFGWLDNLNKVMMVILAVSTALAFFSSTPPPGAWISMVKPWIPAGSLVLVAAILGWMPTGIDVSVWHSFWTLEKLQRLDEKSGQRNAISRHRQLNLSLVDMRTGYCLSAVTALMFICLGAVHLGGRGEELKGVQFVEAICSAYTSILGSWMYHVFMLTAFFAMFSTTYAVIDGFSRAFSETLAILRPDFLGKEDPRRYTYAGFVILSPLFAAATLCTIGNPVTLVTIVALISLSVAPVLYALNLFCVQHHIHGQDLRPARITVVLGWIGVGILFITLGVTVYTKFIG